MEQPKKIKSSSNKVDFVPPAMYNVIMYNDDVTTMDFVVMVLITIFGKNEEDSYNIMMKIHTEGMAIVGKYSYDIAKSKCNKVIKLARNENFPLNVVIRECL